jgi:hypothetical protein
MLTGADVMALTSSLVVGVKAPLECWPIAVDRVRYVGEPVAIVVASDRYRAEDAVDLIEMRYRPLPAVSTRSVPQRPTRRFCIRRSTATSSASARFVTATRSARSRKPRIASASTSATRATPARRSKRTASSPNTMPVKMRNRQFPGTLQSASGHGTRSLVADATSLLSSGFST